MSIGNVFFFGVALFVVVGTLVHVVRNHRAPAKAQAVFNK